MSKTFEKNSTIVKGKSSRRFVEWGTGFITRYRTDIFLRTTLGVIGLQIFFGVVLLVIFWFVLQAAQDRAISATVDGLIESIAIGVSTTSIENLTSVNDISVQEAKKLFFVTLGITVAFAIIVSRVTLAPARNALESQKRFIGNIAHELRTPLAIIRTNIEILLLRRHPDSKTQHVLSGVIEELNRSSKVIDNLVSFSRLLNPKVAEYKNVDLAKITRDAVEKKRKRARQKDIKLIFKKDNHDHIVWGNTVAIEQVVTNLIRNAINYTQKNGIIRISVTQSRKGYALLKVKDPGVGIKSKDLLHIFEPFYRANKSENGSGLGLTIVSEIVKAHRGKIGIQSKVGKGTHVVVAFPKKSTTELNKPDKKENNPNEVFFDYSKDTLL